MILSIFLYICSPFKCLFWRNAYSSLYPFFNWFVYLYTELFEFLLFISKLTLYQISGVRNFSLSVGRLCTLLTISFVVQKQTSRSYFSLWYKLHFQESQFVLEAHWSGEKATFSIKQYITNVDVYKNPLGIMLNIHSDSVHSTDSPVLSNSQVVPTLWSMSNIRAKKAVLENIAFLIRSEEVNRITKIKKVVEVWIGHSTIPASELKVFEI